ncbi:MAG: OsmC family protein [Firmicutes bacterium]|uniref:Putative redox protein n=1 Tax=Melghirimyces thermohalophilus TaxID=1236220 RepID=A0A1G6PG37_9BACL|nr:OsmC family protein [Melghirimyces thermohalophilus]MDA8353938.1 OsmC family protein [Bacillota bacterium]SDC79222.1 putative redox protein [Melghirimyces thermohalophilus]
MKSNIQWKGNMQFDARTPSGHGITIDAAPEVGGENQGPRPMELLLSAAGACSGIDIINILNKMRLQVDAFDMDLSGERAEDHPRRYTHIHIHYRLEGDLPEEKVRRAVDLSRDKYCSVSQSLNAEVTTSFEINGKKYD